MLPRPTPAPRPALRPRVLLGWVGASFLGLVLLVAAWSKVLDPESFAELIRTEGIDVLLPAHVVAFVGIAVEVGVGILLLAGVRSRWCLLLATALVAFFLFLTGRTYWLYLRGEVDPARSCGCFGNLVERTPAEAFWQDVLLLVPALVLAWIGRDRPPRRFPTLRFATACLLAGGVVLFAARAPEMDLDDWATRLRPGIEAASICTGRGEGRVCLSDVIPDLDRGPYLFVIADLADPDLAARVPAWNEHTLAGGPPTLWVLTEAPGERIAEFSLLTGASFPVSETPSGLLRPLHRRLPRSFRVEGGTVTATWSGYPDPAVLGPRSGS